MEEKNTNNVEKEGAKYYNEKRRLYTQRYRKKRKTIQCTLTFLTWKKAMIDEQAAKRNTNLNRYFLGMMEKDTKGQVYIIPDIDEDEAVRQIRSLSEAAAVKDENVDAMIAAMPETDAKALGSLAGDAGVKKEEIVKCLLTYICSEMTYIGAETILLSLEAFGADRESLMAAVKASGVTPVFPEQCRHTEITEPDKDADKDEE